MDSHPSTRGDWLMSGLLGAFGSRRQPGRPRRVLLLVQVSPELQQRVVALARARGHHVLLAGELAEALALLDATIPDLVIVGGEGPELPALLEKIASDYRIGARPQLLSEDSCAEPGRVARLLQLLEAD